MGFVAWNWEICDVGFGHRIADISPFDLHVNANCKKSRLLCWLIVIIIFFGMLDSLGIYTTLGVGGIPEFELLLLLNNILLFSIDVLCISISLFAHCNLFQLNPFIMLKRSLAHKFIIIVGGMLILHCCYLNHNFHGQDEDRLILLKFPHGSFFHIDMASSCFCFGYAMNPIICCNGFSFFFSL